ncbi:MAG TPA: stage V sporulation protein AE [Symbiobacteriaceae bacterium]|jgi:stage V sporulation protein AE
METPPRVILVTDGDKVARRALEWVATDLGLRCISASAGNPSPLTGPEVVALVRQVPHDPVLVMVDDKGNPGRGPGENGLAYICRCGEVQVLGAVAVASNTRRAKGTPVNLSVTREGRVFQGPVDKDGFPEHHRPVLLGDTVDVLRELNVPVVIGIGDPGKMQGADCLAGGFDVTRRAVLEILIRTGVRPPPEPDQSN